jgi:hypothetical protein
MRAPSLQIMPRLLMLMLALFGVSACSTADNSVQATLLWGPVNEQLTDSVATAAPAPAPALSDAQRLRNSLLNPVNRYAPSDKDWRLVRGVDKGPAIFGARLTIGFGENAPTQLRLGAVKRGANRTFGPQLIFNLQQTPDTAPAATTGLAAAASPIFLK